MNDDVQTMNDEVQTKQDDDADPKARDGYRAYAIVINMRAGTLGPTAVTKVRGPETKGLSSLS
jgi:hypothetical protein